MKVKLESLLCVFLMIISAMAGCLDTENTNDEDENNNNNGNDPTNNTGNNTDNNTGNNTDNNTGNNTDNNTGNNTDNNTGNNTDNNTGNNTDNNPCQPNNDTNASNLSDGACCSSGGQCASMNCNYNTWTCEAWDSDGDGMDDSWEESYNLDPDDASDSDDDPDNDNLNNLQEYQNGTNPNQADSDGDGTIDSEDPNPTYPDVIDSDGDGWSDEEEINCDTDPNDSSSAPVDANGDGACDAFNYLTAGTDETTYVAWFDDATMVETTLTTENLTATTTYTLTWYLNKSTDGDEIPDTSVDDGEITITNSNGQQDALQFLIHGPNTAFGLTEGWHCVHADLKQASNGAIITIESDDACFDVISPQDSDQDGYNSTTDCDDNNPNVNPDEDEIWNEIDDNCNGEVDEFLTRIGNASFDMGWNTVGWNIDYTDAEYKGHNLYWLSANHFAYRFLSSQDQVFDWGSACSVDNFVNSINIDETLATLGVDASNITISMSTMNLGTDSEGTEWSYDQNTYIETRYYDGGYFTLMFDDQPFLNVSVGFTQYLNYSDYFVGAPNPQVTMNGSSGVAQLVNELDQVTEPTLWRIAEAFIVDFNNSISFTYDSQEAIIQTEYEEQRAEAIALGVLGEITDLLVVGASTPEWIAAQFTEFEAIASSED